jgi:hypothetical protein
MPNMHFIEKLKNQKLLDRDSHIYESGNWDVAHAKAQSLVGSRIYFHEAQASPSYFGGEITSVRVLPPTDPQAGRVVFIFKADQQGRGVSAGTGGWRNEQKTTD